MTPAFRFPILAAALALAVAVSPCRAADLETVENKTAELYRMRKGIAEQKERIAEAQEKGEGLHAELSEIDQGLKDRQNQLASSQTNLARQEALIATKEQEMERLRQEKTAMETHVKRRLRAYYQTGDVGILNALFSASTLPDLLNIKEYFLFLFDYDRKVIRSYQAKIALLANASVEMRQNRERLLGLIDEVRGQENELSAQRAERAALLERVQGEERLYRQALREVESAAAEMSTALQEMKRTPPPDKAAAFARHKGRLPLPLDGRILQGFGTSKGKYGTLIHSTGIQIEVTEEAEVKAVAEGSVILTGSFKGYDNIVIVDHGDQYYSLVSNLAAITAMNGDRVQAGTVLGLARKQDGGLVGEGLHFEIRRGGEPLDPLEWLAVKRPR